MTIRNLPKGGTKGSVRTTAAGAKAKRVGTVTARTVASAKAAQARVLKAGERSVKRATRIPSPNVKPSFV